MSSDTNNTTEEWRDQISSESRAMAGMIRLMPIKLTVGQAWRVEGHLLLDSRTREVRDAPVFMGIGFASRPAPNANAEAVVVFPGGSSNPVIIATRDEDARKLINSQVDQDAAAVFNRSTIILVKPNGTVEIRAIGGTASKLPTLADYEALRSFVNAQFSGAGHTHATPSGVTTATTPVGSPPGAPAGTTVFKAQ